MAKAKTIKMVTGNVTIDYVQLKRDKSNVAEIIKFGNSKVTDPAASNQISLACAEGVNELTSIGL